MKQLVHFLEACGCTVHKRGRALMVDGEYSECIRGGDFGALWQLDYSVALPVVAPWPVRFFVLSKNGKSVVIFETSVKDYWMKGNGKWDAPLCVGDFFRLDGVPTPYTRAMLMKEKRLAPRRLMTAERRYLRDKDELGSFRVLADKLRGAVV